MQEGVEVNELYERGMERIGCWPCPSSDLAEFEIVKKIHPRLWKKWEETLREAGIRENEIKHGFWRWRKLSKGQKKLAAELKLHIEERNRKRFEYNLCKRNGILSVSGALENLDFDRTLNLAKIFGKVKINKDNFEINGIAVYKNGKFEFNVGDEKEAKKIIKRIYGIAERAKHCFGCGVCLGQCKNNAIELREGKTWITDKCASCQRCHNRCPIIRYSTNNTEFIEV
jgi:phosphoadenosine phosphosulfate reductase